MLFSFVLAFPLSRCIRWENTSKRTDAPHFFPSFLSPFFTPVVEVVVSTDAAANWRRMRRRCPGTSERCSLRRRHCWQGSRAHDHRCLSSTGGELQPPPSLHVCPFASFSFVRALGESFGRALVHHGGDKKGPARQRAASATEELFLLLPSFTQDKPRRRNVSLRDGAPHQLLLLPQGLSGQRRPR